MVDSGIYCTTEQIQKKAGINANSTVSADPYTNIYAALAEGVINTMCNKVFAATQAAFTALPAGGKGMLNDCCSSLAAMYVINDDMSGFTSRAEAELMLNILYDSFIRDIKILQDKTYQDFIMLGA